MMDDDPLAEIRGRPIDDPTEWSALHPRDRAKMRRLHDWLSRPLWSGTLNPAGVLPWPEGVCVLAGIEPEMSADAGAAGWALMPGALAFYGFASFPRDQHEVMQLFMTAEEHIFRLIGLRQKTAPPEDWIAAVAKVGLAPPWAAVVLGSPALRKTLPLRVLAALRMVLGQPVEGDRRANGS